MLGCGRVYKVSVESVTKSVKCVGKWRDVTKGIGECVGRGKERCGEVCCDVGKGKRRYEERCERRC